jgi:hypothetical protein
MPYTHDKSDPNLNNIHKSMEYRDDGKPQMRVSLGSENITISGNVTIPTTVGVNSSPENPIHNHLTEVGTSGILTSPYLPIGGNVAVTSMPEVEIKNDSGNPIPVEWVYGDGSSIIPWEVQVARGKIAGVQGLSISGYNPAVHVDWVPIWGGASYTYLSSAQPVRVWSSSAGDVNVSVMVVGLDQNYNQISETVVLTNGSTGVLTTLSFYRVNSISLTRVPMNAGIIYVGDSGKTIVLSTIEINAGRSQMSIYTVPAGYTFYLTQVNVYTNQVGSQTGIYRSFTQSSTGVINTILTFPFTDNYVSRKVVPRPYPEKTDIQWQCQSSQGDSRVGIQIEGHLIQNSVT